MIAKELNIGEFLLDAFDPFPSNEDGGQQRVVPKLQDLSIDLRPDPRMDWWKEKIGGELGKLGTQQATSNTCPHCRLFKSKIDRIFRDSVQTPNSAMARGLREAQRDAERSHGRLAGVMRRILEKGGGGFEN